MKRFAGIHSKQEINTIVKTIGHSRAFPLSHLPLFLFLTHCTAVDQASNTASQSLPPQPSVQTDAPPLSPQEQLERLNVTLNRA
jgi:hypothetical protein